MGFNTSIRGSQFRSIQNEYETWAPRLLSFQCIIHWCVIAYRKEWYTRGWKALDTQTILSNIKVLVTTRVQEITSIQSFIEGTGWFISLNSLLHIDNPFPGWLSTSSNVPAQVLYMSCYLSPYLSLHGPKLLTLNLKLTKLLPCMRTMHIVWQEKSCANT